MDDDQMHRKVVETFSVLKRWTEPNPGQDDPDEWPYPTEYTLSEISGPLAERIRKRFGADPTARVTITEEVVSGGYSEYTQETDYEHKVECDGHVWRSSANYSQYAGIGRLLDWLNEAAR